MAQSTETKLNKRFDQNIEITGTLDIGGNAEITGTLTVGGNSVLTTSSNINADTVDSKHATDFNLQYVTDNGNSTTNSINGSANGNSGYINSFYNANTGTSSYTEFRIGNSSTQGLRIGSAYNYSDANWNNAWVFAVSRDLALKSDTGNVVIYTNGTTASDIVATFDSNSLTIGETIFGESHPFHTAYSGLWNSERIASANESYLIISQGTDTYINGNKVYIRGGNNSTANQLVVSTSNVTIGGNTVWHSGNDGSLLKANVDDQFFGNLTTGADNHITFGPNTTWGSSLRIGGNGHTATGTEMASVVTTDGNLHLDAADSSNGIYLNYYAGQGGVYFGNGASGYTARMFGNGQLYKGTGTSVPYWNADNDGVGSGLNADLLDGAQLTGQNGIFNNMNDNHTKNQSFAEAYAEGYGVRYVQNGGDGPTGTSSHQWYGFYMGLGSDYNNYGSMLYWGRQNQTSNNPYLWARDLEGGTWGSWRKFSAGYADTAGSATSATNADTVDNLHGTQFLRNDINDIKSGNLVINNNWGDGTYSAEQFTIIGTYPSICLRNTGGDFKWLIHGDSDDGLKLYTGSGSTNTSWTRKLTFDVNGNLAIGLNHNPSFKLDVNGSFRSTGFWSTDSATSHWGAGTSQTIYGTLTWDAGYASIYASSGNELRLGANGTQGSVIIETDGSLQPTRNTATGLSNGSFNVSKSTLGSIHITNGSGPSANAGYQGAITFMGSSTSEAQAGIYVHNNNSYGTAMAFATTNDYGSGPQLFMYADNTGNVTFPRGQVTGNYFRTSGYYSRSNAGQGYLDGGYSSVETTTSTHPIYCISASYAPNPTNLGNMYGIGYALGGSASFITLPDASGWGQYVSAGGTANIFLDASYGHVIGSGTISGTSIKTRTATNGFFGSLQASWSGSTTYPTLYSESSDRWIMHVNPHISYTKNGYNGFSGSMEGSTIRFASNYNAPSYWDLGVGTNGVGADVFAIGRAGARYFDIDSLGYHTINPSGWSSPNRHAALNIGYNGSGQTRAIDIDGNWSANESKAITWTHGSASSNIVGQIDVQHNSPGSRIRWGKLYHSGDSSTYTMELVSTSTTTADLYLKGSTYIDGNVDCDSVGDFGPNSGNNQGIGIRCGSGSGDYGRVRFYFNGYNQSTIHAFSDIWSSGTATSRGCINIDGHYGVTIGSWSSPDALFLEGGASHFNNDVIAYSTTISDAKFKDEVETIPNALDKVKALRGVSYVWNNGSRKGKRDLGVIAQEVEQVLPEIVHEHEMPLMGTGDEKHKTVDYEKVVGVLIEAVKELTNKVEELENKLNGTEQRN